MTRISTVPNVELNEVSSSIPYIRYSHGRNVSIAINDTTLQTERGKSER